jgi:hypothetical protein
MGGPVKVLYTFLGFLCILALMKIALLRIIRGSGIDKCSSIITGNAKHASRLSKCNDLLQNICMKCFLSPYYAQHTESNVRIMECY